MVTIADVARLFPDRRLELLEPGDEGFPLAGVASIGEDDADCLVWARDARRLTGSRAALAIVPADAHLPDAPAVRAILRSPTPRLDFARALQALFAPERPSGIHPSAVVHPDAAVAASAFVGACTVVGRAVIGERCVVHSGVHIYDGSRIRNDVIIHSGTVIGSDGFGYERDENGVPQKLPHLGGVEIGDRVEIGSNTSIDRGTLGDTVIESDAKIDNLIHIAHNVRIGARTMIAAGAEVSGSCRVGSDVWIGPQATVSDGLTIGDGAQITLGAVVTRNVPAEARVTGNFAIDHATFMRNLKRSTASED